jgi:hypothetical protein
MNAHHRRLVGPLFVRQAYAVLLALTTSFTGRIEPLQAAEIYRSVDAEGHVVYSDHLDDSVAQTPVQINDPNLFSDDEARSSEAPPPLLDDPLPPCPEDGDLWTPGYWSRNAGGFFWVPGDWFPPPRIGLLWTPGYWQYVDAVYIFHRGYWAPHVGYYGGVNYGSGYFGTAFTGGRWVGRSFAYNLAVYGANARIFHDTYTESVPTRSDHDRVSFNGGPGGITRVITADEYSSDPAATAHSGACRRHSHALGAAGTSGNSAGDPCRAVCSRQCPPGTADRSQSHVDVRGTYRCACDCSTRGGTRGVESPGDASGGHAQECRPGKIAGASAILTVP